MAFNSSSSTLTWKQTTTGANASGMLTVKEGTSSMSFTLVGSYTVSNFSATSDGHGGTLITDPAITNGGSPGATSGGTGSGSEGIAGAPGSGTTVHSGGYEFGGGAGPFGGGMRQLDLLLSHFDGVISGFDLGDEIGPHSLGFGSSSNARSWGANAGPPGVDKGGATFNLTLLGQYSAANFNAGGDGHGTLITDPPASSSVVQAPLVVHHLTPSGLRGPGQAHRPEGPIVLPQCNTWSAKRVARPLARERPPPPKEGCQPIKRTSGLRSAF